MSSKTGQKAEGFGIRRGMPFDMCPYCGERVRLATFSSPDYPYRKNYQPVWICVDCSAWVGCHQNTKTPKGMVADSADRRLRMVGHGVFDPIWKEGRMKRGEAYRRLSKAFGRPAHFSWETGEELARLVDCAKGLK